MHVVSLESTREAYKLLYSWRFSRYGAPIHWLVHGHITSYNETVSRQMPRAGNIGKTIKREIAHYYPRNGDCICTWPDVVAGISARFSKFAFVLFCYITYLLLFCFAI